MEKIGIYGGAFNPPHLGHINLLSQVVSELKLKKIIIIPTGSPPHKESGNLSFEHRAEMSRLAFSEFPAGVEAVVSDIEKGDKMSYTINTLRKLRTNERLIPRNSKLYLIIGSDMLFYFDKWYKYESILKETNVIAAARQETDSFADMTELATELGHIRVLNLPIVEVSSSKIRELASSPETFNEISEFLPESVFDYIKNNKLYL